MSTRTSRTSASRRACRRRTRPTGSSWARSTTSRPSRSAARSVDGRADQYALGCLLFECLTGSLPFRQRSEVAAIFAHLEEAAPAASERRETLPPAVDPVLARAMAKEPAERFDSCRALVAATHDALGLAPPPSPRSRWLVPVLALAVARARHRRRRARPRPRARGRTPPRRTARSRASTRDEPRSRHTKVPGYPQAVAVTAGGVWMADFREGVLWRYDPRTQAPAADHLQRRAARHRRARRPGLRRGRRQHVHGRRSRATTRPRASARTARTARLRARVWRRRRVGGGLPVRRSPEHRWATAAHAAPRFVEFQPPGTASTTPRPVPRARASAPARCGCSGTRSTAACGDWMLAAARSRRRSP